MPVAPTMPASAPIRSQCRTTSPGLVEGVASEAAGAATETPTPKTTPPPTPKKGGDNGLIRQTPF